ncbi:ROK family protein [Aestuariibius insulae]|uniref:ROK family transcriptional regulator n=1 Tax=Aestuariibius insulae TaxID=2058287 RepID=UPI00345E4F3A
MQTPRRIQGSNAGRSRSHNKRLVLGHIQAKGEMGRAEIARASGLTTQAVSNIIADLEGDGMLVTRGHRSEGRGLPALQYAVNPVGGFALGIEVRPDAILSALLDLEGATRHTGRAALPDTHPATVADLVRQLRDEASRAVPDSEGRILGAGIVMPGPFGPTGLSGLSGTTTDLKGWRNMNARELFQEALDLPVEVENDANAAALAERISGAARGMESYAYLYFGAGLGLGIVSGGQLISGAFGNAGEIGHIPVPSPDGPAPLETLASRAALRTQLDIGADDLDIAALEALFARSDPALTGWMDQAAGALGHAALLIENILDPQTIILGGAMPEALLDGLIARIALPEASISNRPDNPHPRLIRGTCGRLTATMGAAALILNVAFTPQLASVA